MKRTFFGIAFAVSVGTVCSLGTVCSVDAQESGTMPPTFRPRTDGLSVHEMDALRERLKDIVDSKGKINPLSDYVTPTTSGKKSQRRETINSTDDEATGRPSLSADELARLKKSPPAPLESEFAPAPLLPPPQFYVTSNSSNYPRDVDGFVPVTASSLARTYSNSSQADSSFVSPASATIGTSLPYGTIAIPTVVTSNYQSPIDPLSTLPPSLPGGYGAPIPGYSGVPNTNILPGAAQPNIVPNSTQPIPINPRDSVLPNYPAAPARTFVNSAPFVSRPPNQFDAQCMVSPATYRQALNPCTTPARPIAPGATTGAIQPAGSPFVYAQPTYLPAPAPISPNNGGFYPLLGFGQQLSNAQLGRGIIGQPTAYVPGQPVRNFLRYISP